MALENIEQVEIRSNERFAEISWFDNLIGGDTEYLGIFDSERRSSFEHCKDIALTAEQLGFSSLLLPTAFTVGQEVLTFASGIAPLTSKINLLAAIRCGEYHPPMLARSLASLDHMLKGRLAINIINSDLPGTKEDPYYRYQRCAETIEILKQGWTQDSIDYSGEIYNVKIPNTQPVKPYQQNGGPLLYFGGTSEGSREVCAKYCDVFLMWPENEESLYETMQDMSARAAEYGRKIDFGLRIHVVVRETEEEARAYSKKLMSQFDEVRGAEIKQRAQCAQSLGVLRQDKLREEVADDDGYIEDIVWMGIGKVFAGCGSGLVGSAEQVVAKINRYIDMGIRSFIFSGFPLIEEATYFSNLVLPHFTNKSLTRLQNRVGEEEPVTPLTTAEIV